MDKIYKKLGYTVKKYRKAKSYSTNKLAEKLNTSVGLINTLENSRHDIFKLELFINLLHELCIPLEEIFEFKDLDQNPIYIKDASLSAKEIESNECIDYINCSLNIIIKSFLSIIDEYDYNKKAIDKITRNILTNLEIIELGFGK